MSPALTRETIRHVSLKFTFPLIHVFSLELAKLVSLLLHSSSSAHDATNFLQFIRPLAGRIGWKAVGNKVAERTSRLALDRSSEFIEFQMESRIRAEHENVASAKPKYCFEGC